MPIVTSSVLGGIQSAVGIAQFLKGQSIAKQNARPNYQIPDEIKQNLSQAQMTALEGLPPEQKQQYIENVQRQTNQGLNALGERSAGIGGLSALTQNANDANKNLLAMDSQARQSNQAGLMNARTQMAGYQDKAFELNKLLPFQQNGAMAAALQGSGIQNAVGGTNSLQNTIENKYKIDNSKDPSKVIDTTPPAITTTPSPTFGQPSTTRQQTPQRTDIMAQYQIAKMSNPGLTLQQFMASQPQMGGLAFQNNITY